MNRKNILIPSMEARLATIRMEGIHMLTVCPVQ